MIILMSNFMSLFQRIYMDHIFRSERPICLVNILYSAQLVIPGTDYKKNETLADDLFNND